MGRRRTSKASSTEETAVSSLTPNPEFESFATDGWRKPSLISTASEVGASGAVAFSGHDSGVVALLIVAESLANQGGQLTMTPAGASEVNEPPRSGLIS
jgi:hypothetical protein